MPDRNMPNLWKMTIGFRRTQECARSSIDTVRCRRAGQLLYRPNRGLSRAAPRLRSSISSRTAAVGPKAAPPCSSCEQPRGVEDVHPKSKGAVVAYQCGGRGR